MQFQHEVLVLLCPMLSLCASVSPPNVVVFFADDLGYGDLPAFGHPTSATPNLDELFSGGALLSQFYTTTGLCTPSRSSLLTARYPVRTGVWPGNFAPGSVGGLPHSETTIAEVFKAEGYSTGHVGKWHLGIGENFTYLPHNQGFDMYYGIPYSHDMCPCMRCFYPNQGCDSHDTCSNKTDGLPCPLIKAENGSARIIEQPADLITLSERLTAQAISFLSESINKSRQFFLYYAFHHTHTPQFSGQMFRNASDRGDFGDSLLEMDHAVGEVMKALGSQRQKTIVVFASDNGPELKRETEAGSAGLLKCGKHTTWEGGTRVPALFYWPRKIPPHRSVQVASTLDVLPTLVSLAGIELPNNLTLDGYDISAKLLDPSRKSVRDHMIFYPTQPNPDIGLYAVRYKQFKAYYFTEGSAVSGPPFLDGNCTEGLKRHLKPLLFDLSIDPSESYNINNKPGSEEILVKIHAVKVAHERGMVWAPSQMARGEEDRLKPCCRPGCSPFPSCCTCHSRMSCSKPVRDLV